MHFIEQHDTLTWTKSVIQSQEINSGNLHYITISTTPGSQCVHVYIVYIVYEHIQKEKIFILLSVRQC